MELQGATTATATGASPFPVLWIGVAIFGICALGGLSFVIQAIWVTYQMLRGLKPDVRRGALLGALSIVGESVGEGYFFSSPDGVGDGDSHGGCDADSGCIGD